MASAPSTNAVTPAAAAAARVAIAAVIAYQLLAAALIPLRPDLDPSWHTISEWAIGSYGWMMTTAFLLSAAAYAALFVAIRREARGALGRTGLGFLLLCVIGTFGVGAFTTDPLGTPPQALSTRGILHVVFGSTALLLLPVAALLLNLALARRDAWWPVRRALLWTAGLPLVAFLGSLVYTIVDVVPHGPGAYGPGVHIGWPPRLVFASYAVWLITIASRVIRIAGLEPRTAAARAVLAGGEPTG